MIVPMAHLGHLQLDRRAALTAGTLGFCGASLPDLLPAAQTPDRKTAKSVILIWLTGGPSHIDLWDMKPRAPATVRGEFKPIATSATGMHLAEILPHTARQAHQLAIVRSLGHYNRARNDHHTGYFYNLTGHAPEPPFLNSRRPRPDDWPYLGCVVGSRRPAHPYLPNVITLPAMAGEPGSYRPGQFAGRLGIQHEPMFVIGDLKRPLDFKVPALSLRKGMTQQRLLDRRRLLQSFDGAQRELERANAVDQFTQHQQRALSLMTSRRSKAAFDLTREPQKVRDRYGPGVNAMSMLMARRLVEIGVPMVTIFWKHDYEEDKRIGCLGGAWDTHWKNFSCLKKVLVPKFDKPFATLLADLSERGLLDDTLVVVTSEMGRAPRIGDPRSGGTKGSGRDHWTHCMSVLMAGGGIRGGQYYGTSDRIGAYPADNPVGPEDITKTIYYAMGIDNLRARDASGRTFNLMDEGKPILPLF